MVEEKKGQVAKKGAKKAVKKVRAKSYKRRRRSGKESYTTYIYKVREQVHPNTDITSQGTSVINSFINKVQATMRLLLPRKLAKHARRRKQEQ